MKDKKAKHFSNPHLVADTKSKGFCIMKDKKAQITIFVILGILLIGTIIFFILFRQGENITIGGKSESNIKGVFESCMEENVKETIQILMKQGGYLENTLNISFKFKKSKEIQNISYLCYTTKEYLSCINQEPMLMNHLTEEIKNNISKQVKICFDEIVKNIGNKEEAVEANYNGFNVEIVPRKIIVNVDGEITSTKSGQTTTQRNITGMFQSRLYEIATVVQEITNQEATYCNFDLLGFMMFYPEFEIDKALTRNSTSIYTVKHNKGIEEFNFAVRSCSFPPGF